MPTSPSASPTVLKKKEGNKKKKTPSSKLSPDVIKTRREAIEKRILKLEGKLSKDRLLLMRYAEEV